MVPDPTDTSTRVSPVKIVGEVKEPIRDWNTVIRGPAQDGYVRCTYVGPRTWHERLLEEGMK